MRKTWYTGDRSCTNDVRKCTIDYAARWYQVREKFYAVPDKVNGESGYMTGIQEFSIDHGKKNIHGILPGLLDAITGFHGGQLIYLDLVRIDTAGYGTKSSFGQWKLLPDHLLLPDITLYDVIKRVKVLTIQPKLISPCRHAPAPGNTGESAGPVLENILPWNQQTRNWIWFLPAAATGKLPAGGRLFRIKNSSHSRARQLPAFTFQSFGGKNNKQCVQGETAITGFLGSMVRPLRSIHTQSAGAVW